MPIRCPLLYVELLCSKRSNGIVWHKLGALLEKKLFIFQSKKKFKLSKEDAISSLKSLRSLKNSNLKTCNSPTNCLQIWKNVCGSRQLSTGPCCLAEWLTGQWLVTTSLDMAFLAAWACFKMLKSYLFFFFLRKLLNWSKTLESKNLSILSAEKSAPVIGGRRKIKNLYKVQAFCGFCVCACNTLLMVKNVRFFKFQRPVYWYQSFRLIKI